MSHKSAIVRNFREIIWAENQGEFFCFVLQVLYVTRKFKKFDDRKSAKNLIRD